MKIYFEIINSIPLISKIIAQNGQLLNKKPSENADRIGRHLYIYNYMHVYIYIIILKSILLY